MIISFPTKFVFLSLILLLAAGRTSGQTDEMPVTTKSQEALKLFIEGRTYQDNLRGYESISCLEKAIDIDGNFAMAYALLAISQSLVGNSADYAANIKKALSLSSKASKAEQLFIKALNEGSNLRYDKEKELLIQLTALFPKDKRTHYYLGLFYYSRTDYQPAIESLGRSVELDDGFAPAYNMLGYSYSAAANYAEAEKALTRYTELLPKEPNPFDSLGEILMKEGKFEKSIAAYEKALEINVNFTSAFVGISNNLMFMGKYEQARKKLHAYYDQAFMQSQFRNALYGLMCTYLHEGNYEKALLELEKLYALNEKGKNFPEMIRNIFIKGDILLLAENKAIALKAYQGAAELIEKADIPKTDKTAFRQRYLYSIIRVQVSNNEIAKAVQSAEKYKKEASSSKDEGQMRIYHEIMGHIALAEKRFGDAVKEFEMGQPENPRTMFFLAEAYLESGDKTRAKIEYTRAANFNQDNYYFHLFRRKALLRLSES